MTVKELIKALQKMDQEKSVYFRDGSYLKPITMGTNSPHSRGLFVELTNDGSNLMLASYQTRSIEFSPLGIIITIPNGRNLQNRNLMFNFEL